MPRTPGARNQDHEAKKRVLATKVLRAVVRRGSQTSLHEMAREADASIPTLKHYFGDRSGAVAEALRTVRADAEPHLAAIAQPGRLGLAASLTKVARDLAEAWQAHGVGRLFSSGLAAGLFDDQAGPGYLDGVLEPTILAMEARLRVHAQRGEASVDPQDELVVRTASLAFLSPLIVALIHQHGLSGTTCRPLDVDRFIDLHVQRFVAAYGPARAGGRSL